MLMLYLQYLGNSGRYTLLGFDGSPPQLLRALGSADCSCIHSFRMTEIIEFSLSLHSESKQQSSVQPTSSTSTTTGGFSFTGLFGGASSKTTVSQEAASNTPTSDGASQLQSVSMALCPLKLKFAIVLAEFGLTETSLEYIVDIKRQILGRWVGSVYSVVNYCILLIYLLCVCTYQYTCTLNINLAHIYSKHLLYCI
jgi:hypothetical protein